MMADLLHAQRNHRIDARRAGMRQAINDAAVTTTR
jgi:hypothetical protein